MLNENDFKKFILERAKECGRRSAEDGFTQARLMDFLRIEGLHFVGWDFDTEIVKAFEEGKKEGNKND